MGVQVALARIGSQAGYAVAIPLARAFGITTPVLVGLILLLGGLVAFFIFSVMDKKLDRQMEAEAIAAGTEGEEEKFSFKDVKNILVNPGFWLIALLCVLFYSCVFPFQKFVRFQMVVNEGDCISVNFQFINCRTIITTFILQFSCCKSGQGYV